MNKLKHSNHPMRKEISLIFALMSVLAFFVTGSFTCTHAQSIETWRLVKREYPVLPNNIVDIQTGRNAGTYIKVERTQRKGEAVYISRSVAHGQQECLWISAFTWDDNVPEVITTGKEYFIKLEARLDRKEGGVCGMGRIGVTFGSRAEPLRDRAPNVVHINGWVVATPSGGISSPAASEVFRVDARPDLPQNDTFTIAIHISDGGVTDQVVALYVYEKIPN